VIPAALRALARGGLLDQAAKYASRIELVVAGTSACGVAVVVGNRRLDQHDQSLFGEFALGMAVQIRGQQARARVGFRSTRRARMASRRSPRSSGDAAFVTRLGRATAAVSSLV